MVIRSLVGEGGLNARVVIEITVAMNNEKEEEEREGGKGVCLSVRPHHTLFGWGQTSGRGRTRTSKL